MIAKKVTKIRDMDSRSDDSPQIETLVVAKKLNKEEDTLQKRFGSLKNSKKNSGKKSFEKFLTLKQTKMHKCIIDTNHINLPGLGDDDFCLFSKN